MLLPLSLSACSTGKSSGTATGTDASSDSASAHTSGAIKIAVIPKINGIPYYQAVKKGVDEAAAELGDKVDVIWNGPSSDEASQQVQIVENMVNAKVDVIAIAANDPDAVTPALKEAQAAGIKVITWDGDAGTRDAFVQLVDPDAFGAEFVKEMVDQVGEDADVAIITSTFTAPNQNSWIEGINKAIEKDYPQLNIVTTVESGEDQQEAMNQATNILQAYPDVKGIFAITTAALPGAAQAVEELGKSGQIAIVGNSTPNVINQYFKSGTLKSAALWNPIDHGYLTVMTAYADARGEIAEGTSFEAGRLGSYTPESDDVSLAITLGEPLVFTAENIDDYDF